jgi:hypothetical protein
MAKPQVWHTPLFLVWRSEATLFYTNIASYKIMQGISKKPKIISSGYSFTCWWDCLALFFHDNTWFLQKKEKKAKNCQVITWDITLPSDGRHSWMPHTGPSNHLLGTYFGNALKLGVVLHKTQFSECAKLMNRYMKFICGQQTNQ